MLAQVVPGPDGKLRDELRAGISPPAEAELVSWEQLPPGAQVLSEVGGREAYPGAAAEYYLRNGADASLEVNQVVGGEPRTVVPSVARATVSLRLAPGQRASEIGPELERLLREAAPEQADVTIRSHLADPSLFEPDLPAITLAAQAIERATGAAPALIRTGGSIPVVAEFAARRIPTVVSGFGLPEDDIHAPNESYRLESLELGSRAARELLTSFAAL
jgi:acetylornithine deacetylase/succinyl-diaminopimelate desuccinylase-like protein